MAFHMGKKGGKRRELFLHFLSKLSNNTKCWTEAAAPRACSLLPNGNENCIHNVRWTSWHRPPLPNQSVPPPTTPSSPLSITKCDLECAVAAIAVVVVVVGRLSLLWRANKSGRQRNVACHKLTNVNGRHIALLRPLAPRIITQQQKQQQHEKPHRRLLFTAAHICLFRLCWQWWKVSKDIKRPYKKMIVDWLQLQGAHTAAYAGNCA